MWRKIYELYPGVKVHLVDSLTIVKGRVVYNEDGSELGASVRNSREAPQGGLQTVRYPYFLKILEKAEYRLEYKLVVSGIHCRDEI